MQAYRDGNNGALAAAGDWFAHNAEYFAGAGMIIAGGLLMYTGIGGPIGLGLIGAGADTIIQKATTGSVNWAQTALTAVAGGVGGGIAAARLGALGIEGAQAAIAISAASGASGGGAGSAYTYATSPGPHTTEEFIGATAAGAFTGAALGAAGGTISGGLSRATSRLFPKLKDKLPASAASPETTTPPQEPLSAISTVPDSEINLYEYTLHHGVLKHSQELQNNGALARPYNELRLVMQQIVDGGTEVADRNQYLTKFVVSGGWNGSLGMWELVLDKESKEVVHYLYRSLPKK
ncbi:hypothetical protein [Rathayibacter rathayi]|uniref:hypothetical protein n=1 Tax=Rathayibacter rathayi TaxID=33887 RepID=UPI0011B08092|nr:hypothetical protein [Rathayibacter rathayi]